MGSYGVLHGAQERFAARYTPIILTKRSDPINYPLEGKDYGYASFSRPHNQRSGTSCWCGRKATMVVRLDEEGRVLAEGDQVSIGGEESYVSLCRRHWEEKNVGPKNQLKLFL